MRGNMQTATEPQEQEITIISKEVPALVSEAESFNVTSDDQYHEAVERANICKLKYQKIIDFFRPLKESTHKAWKDVCAKENQYAPALDGAKKLYTQKAADWQFKKQQETEEKERKAREVAEAAEAKKKAELQAKIDEENRKAEEARKAGDEKAAAEAALKAESLTEKKENVYVAARPVIQAPKSNSLSVQMVWEPQILDESKVPVQFWKEIDITKLKRMKKDDPKLEVPGIKFIQKAQGGAIGKKF